MADPVYGGGILLNGTTQNWRNPALHYTFRHTLAHEFGHKLGLSHLPPDHYQHHEEKYYYGPYGCMRNQKIPALGFIPYHPINLVRLGWLSEPVIVISNLKDVEIFDIRNDQLGQLYQFNLGQSGLQYFMLAYHALEDEDAAPDSLGRTLFKSRGLEIWHVKDTAPYDVIDLESAWGRYNDPSSPPDPLDWDPSLCPEDYPESWNQGDSILGYDNHDVWDGRGIQDARRYQGSECDFYSTHNGTGEFSYRTNPNPSSTVCRLTPNHFC